jgi:hypothetical protein
MQRRQQHLAGAAGTRHTAAAPSRCRSSFFGQVPMRRAIGFIVAAVAAQAPADWAARAWRPPETAPGARRARTLRLARACAAGSRMRTRRRRMAERRRGRHNACSSALGPAGGSAVCWGCQPEHRCSGGRLRNSKPRREHPSAEAIISPRGQHASGHEAQVHVAARGCAAAATRSVRWSNRRAPRTRATRARMALACGQPCCARKAGQPARRPPSSEMEQLPPCAVRGPLTRMRALHVDDNSRQRGSTCILCSSIRHTACSLPMTPGLTAPHPRSSSAEHAPT